MKREILVSVSGGEAWVALEEDGVLVEIMFERPGPGRLVGDVFLGRVEAVLPGIQAAFVDIGEEKAAFLHASDVVREDGQGSGDERSGSRNRRPGPIQDAVRRGQSILVQVTKEPISTKGPRATMEVSLPGRFLVYLPLSSHVGVSRKISERGERARLRRMATAVVQEGQGGVIVRTAGEELSEERLADEYRRLQERWEGIARRASSREPPALVHDEAKLVSGVVRDLFTDKFDAVVIDDRRTHQDIAEYVRAFAPELLDRVHLYEGAAPLFDHAGVDEQLRRAVCRKVELPTGGHVIIEQTEALVSVDVNTGRFTGKKKSPEDTILKTNLEAAREIATQLRVRDAGGIVVIDFIDMESDAHRDAVLRELRSRLRRDRARTRTFGISALGLVEMTRQRVRPSLLHALTEPCGECGGDGRVAVAATVLRDVERSVLRAGSAGESDILAKVHPRVALHALETQPGFARSLGKRAGVRMDLRDDPLLRQGDFRLLSGRAASDVTEKYRA